MKLGKRIANIRRSKGVSQIFINDSLGKSHGWLSNIESGRREISAEELGKIAEILGVDVGVFFRNNLNLPLSYTGTDQ